VDLDLGTASGLVRVAGHSALCSQLPVRHRKLSLRIETCCRPARLVFGLFTVAFFGSWLSATTGMQHI